MQNLEETLSKIRPYLKVYLQGMGIKFGSSHFQCPNFQVHKNDDSKPAASFWPDGEHFKCFACEARGDIFDAATYLEGRPVSGPEFLTDTVVYLAEKYSIPFNLPNANSIEGTRSQIYAALEYAESLVYSVLEQQKSEQAHEYLKNRSWDTAIKPFKLGFCNYSKLIELLKARFSDKILEEAGLLDSNLLNERLLFPLKNHFGKTVGFASRKIGNGDTEKYLNSITTDVYKKSGFLYNLYNAKKYPSVYVFEGYSDVLTACTKGLENVVALGWGTLSEGQFSLLVKSGIREIVICLDNDQGGENALESILKSFLVKQEDIKVKIKCLDKWEDPDEYFVKEGVEKFKLLPEDSVFDFRLKQLQDSKVTRETLLDLIVWEASSVERELKCRKLAEVLGVSFEAVQGDAGTQGKQSLTTEDSFEKEVIKFDEWAFSRSGSLLGLDTGFPMLTQKLDGLQQGFYIVGADSNVGKTALILGLIHNLIQYNPDKVYVLFFSLDDPIKVKIIPRLIAAISSISINTIANPIYKIQKNPVLSPEQVTMMLQEREKAVTRVKQMTTCLTLKDESSEQGMRQLTVIGKAIAKYRKVADKRQLVVFIDSIHKIQGDERADVRKKYMDISDTLKAWTTTYEIPLLVTAELRKKQSATNKPVLEDLKETVDLIYDSDVGMLLYNEFDNKRDTQLQFIDKNTVYPVVELMVRKNKISSFKGNLYYKFYTDFSKFEECTIEETRKFQGLKY